MTEGYYRMNLERNNMDTEQLKRIADAMEQERNYRTGEVTELARIANAIEEILRIVKKDMEPRTKKNEEN